jgi:Insect cuticle protein
LFAFIACASASPVHYSYQPTYVKAVAPVVYKAPVAVYKHVEYPDAPAEYEFAYDVNDEHTGDVHSQKESRHGDNVQGEYSLIDADGHRRTVTYTADEHHGFQATVNREPIQGYVQKVAVTPVVKYTAPVVKYTAPVVKYTAPVYKYTAPVVKYTSAPAYKVAAVPVDHAAHSSVSFHGPAHNYHY